MASTILLRTFSGVDDKRIVLTNSNFARPFSIPSGWTKLRVALRISITDTGGDITSNPRLAMGLCSGSSNIFLDATTTHFVGALQDEATWSRQAGPPVRYVEPAGGWVPAKRVGSTTTKGATFYGSALIMFDATTANRSAKFVDIEKGSPNYTLNIFGREQNAASDVSPEQFLAQAELATPTITNHSLRTAQTIAVNEGTDGVLDHVCVAWDRSAPNIEISDIALIKLA